MSTERNPVVALLASSPVLMFAEQQQDFIGAAVAALGKNERIDEMLAESNVAADNFWPEPDSWRAAYRPYIIQDGVLHIPVRGILLHNFPWQDGAWATGYEYIQRAFERGCADFSAGNIKGIAFIGHSGGGMVSGCWDAVDRMVAAKESCGVPVRAFATEFMYSAAYGVASVADEIWVTRSGGVGSIGTLRTHADWTAFNDKMGVKYTFVATGKLKAEGHPDKQLTAETIKRWEAEVAELNEIFVAAVSRSRGLDAQAILDFEAATFTASQALSNGLADKIGSLDDALAAYAADLSSTSQGDEQMSTQDTAADTQAAITAAVADANRLAEQNQASAIAAAVTAEKDRMSGILALDEATGRETLANHFAMKTSMSVEDAKAALAAAPLAAAPAVAETPATDPLASAMTATGGGTGVGADAGNDAEADPVSAQIAADKALAASVGLKGHTAPAGK